MTIDMELSDDIKQQLLKTSPKEWEGKPLSMLAISVIYRKDTRKIEEMQATWAGKSNYIAVTPVFIANGIKPWVKSRGKKLQICEYKLERVDTVLTDDGAVRYYIYRRINGTKEVSPAEG